MSRQTLLVLAGGLFQIPLIDAAKRRGLRVVLFDGSADAPGFSRADEGDVVDIADPVASVAAARRVRPDGLASIVNEASVRTTAAIAEALGLPGLDPAVAARCTDKGLMRTCFARAGLPVPRFAVVAHADEASRASGRIGFPMVVKPVDSSGSRGVRRVDAPGDLAAAVDLALSNSRQQQAILESFLEGTECTVETFTVGGRTHVLGMSDKVHLPFPHCVSISLTYPPFFDEGTRGAIGGAAIAAIDATGMRNGPGHVEVIVTPAGPVVVEVAARGGGYGIFSEILLAISGIDPVDAVIDLALGRVPDVQPTTARAAVLRFFNPPVTGILRQLDGVDEARRIPGVSRVVVEAKVGEPLRGITRDGERPGYVITVADTREDALASANRAEAAVRFTIDPEPSQVAHETR
ncbi:MAG TPA: ATP-grasp domain-containing protein [Vicinamibacterales bacterium]|nr:ATP-grasp domain-containing protein [Vicinamibacterales bacterium]